MGFKLAVMLLLFAAADAKSAIFHIADGDTNGLIDAINLANSNGGPDVINLATNGTYTLRRVVHMGDFFPDKAGTDANGLPPITGEITINGFGAIVRRKQSPHTLSFRILQVGDESAPGDVAINNLSLCNGYASGFGGGVVIYAGTAGFERCRITDNSVGCDDRGGGISNFGYCTVRDSLISHNSVGFCGPSIDRRPHWGGGLHNAGTALIESCEFYHNGGAGISNEAPGILQVIGTTVKNSSHSGIANGVDAAYPPLRILYESPNFFDDTLLIVSDCEITSNGETGIASSGTLVVSTTSIQRNAGGILSAGDLTVDNCIISNNNHSLCGQLCSGYGGVVILGVGRLYSTSVRNNISDVVASGVGVRSSFAPQGLLTIEGCEISGNRSESEGGGGVLGSASSSEDFRVIVTISNSTITNNHDSEGGGVRVQGSALAQVSNSTVSGNTSDVGGGISVFGYSWPQTKAPRVVLENTIISTQSGVPDCVVDQGAITSRGHNLDSDGTCNLDSNGDIPFGFANLGPLQDNGGPTWTHALLPGSDAIDAGNTDACAAEPVDGVDQRGYPRPAGLACDIGAFEVGDFDNDGVIDGVDTCLSPAEQPVNSDGGPLGDIDDDCAVTLEDYFYFEICLLLSGPGDEPVFSDCTDVFDFDDDSDVDLFDYAAIQQVLMLR